MSKKPASGAGNGAGKVLEMIGEHSVEYVDLRFTDTRGKEQHTTRRGSDGRGPVPRRQDVRRLLDRRLEGHQRVGHDPHARAGTAVIDPFFASRNIRCDVIEPATMQGYERDPRSLAKRAEAYLKSTGIADSALFGPENEFFIFDSVRYGNGRALARSTRSTRCRAAWNSPKEYADGNKGHRPGDQGRLLPGAAGGRVRTCARPCA